MNAEIYKRIIGHYLEFHEKGVVTALRRKTLIVGSERRYMFPLSKESMVGSLKYKMLMKHGLMESFNDLAKEEVQLPDSLCDLLELDFSENLSTPYSCSEREVGLFPTAVSTDNEVAITGLNINSMGRSGITYLYLLRNNGGEWIIEEAVMVQQWCS